MPTVVLLCAVTRQIYQHERIKHCSPSWHALVFVSAMTHDWTEQFASRQAKASIGGSTEWQQTVLAVEGSTILHLYL